MPQPTRVLRHLKLFDSSDPLTIDPSPSSAQPSVSATQAWSRSTSHRLPGSYQLLLGQFSSLYPFDAIRKRADIQNVFAWVIVGHRVAYPFFSGDSAPVSHNTASRPPPCRFAQTIEAIDAVTGHGLIQHASSTS
jgi:hypothetical protein